MRPTRDVEIVEGRTVATSDEPWLRLDPTDAFVPGGFVEIVYRASIFDDPVRPILRFRTSDGEEIERLLPGPVAGAGIWVGRVPHRTADIWITPTRHRGRFDFVVERARRRNGLALWWQALCRSPRYALSALFYGVAGFRAEYDMNLDWALGFTPLSEFEAWRVKRTRALDLTGVDAPRTDWATGPRIHVLIRGSDPADRDASLRSLHAQIYGNWVQHDAGEWLDRGGSADLAFILRSGDELHPHAFACAIEHAARHPAQQIFYADEIERDAQGAALRPSFKPDWSPLLQAARPYLGRAVFARADFLRSRGLESPPDDLSAAIGAPEAFPAAGIGHLRRMLLTRSAEPEVSPAPAPPERGPGPGPAPAASIVIPTRDRGDLLEQCVESIFADGDIPDYTIVIVDNGSVSPATRAVLARLGSDARVTVVSEPGPFNFAALCNAGAALGEQPVLVFLNDDTCIASPDWLQQLTAAAVRRETGAVGAKLLYPDGRLQHVGVSLGIGETAGHFGAGASQAEAGWVGRHVVLHEVSAVTGACLAVERRKFEAVGGFDAVNLPIELNDVDLCLRLSERGWKSLCLSQVRLLHEESATRGGAKFRLLKVHHQERAHFLQRWRNSVRDDPFFHPAFSLFGRQQTLG